MMERILPQKRLKMPGPLNKADIRQALVTLKMPEVIEHMKDDTISFSKDYRESQFDLWMEQLYYNATIGETRPDYCLAGHHKNNRFRTP